MRFDLPAFRYFLRREFWKGLWKEVNEDDCLGMAAQLSFYFLLAFFPFLIFLSALIGFLDIEPDLLNKILVELYNFLPSRTYEVVREIIENLVQSQDKGVLSLGIVLALWSASLAFNAMVGLLNNAYEVKDTRSYFKTRALSILVTIVVSLFLVASGILLFFGDWLIQLLVQTASLRTVYTVVRWVLIFLLLNVGIQIVYFSLPARRLPWRFLSPGSVAASLGWIFGSLGFTYYVNHFGNYQKLYGSLGAIVVLMLWFYLGSLFLLLGGEIDSEIYRLSRQDKKREAAEAMRLIKRPRSVDGSDG